MKSHRRLLWPALGLLVAFAGCGGNGDRPPLGTVSGKVTLDGEPLPKATISFHPIDGGRQSYAHPDKEGHYDLIYIRDIKGAKVGKHKVTIRTAGSEDTDKAHDKELVSSQASPAWCL